MSAGDVIIEVVKEGIRSTFNELERQTIKKYFKENKYVHYMEEDDTESDSYKHNGKGKSKNKGKNKGLPPCIAKNLERGKLLSHGIAKRDLPHDLDSSITQST